MAVKKSKRAIKEIEGLSQDTRTILVVLTILLAYPVGLILMFLWMRWPTWLKLIISLPVLLIMLGMALIVVLAFK